MMKKNSIDQIKKSGFEVPKNYFDHIEQSILDTAKLKSLSETSGFKTPKNYFETLEDIILEKVSEHKTPKILPLFSRKYMIYASSIAAAVLLLFNLSIFEDKMSWDDVDVKTVENYIINENIESYDIASLMTEEDILETHFVTHKLNEDAVESYILEYVEIEDLLID